MKKFITFALAALVIFAMCSCQPTVDNLGPVAFTVNSGSVQAKAIAATPFDPSEIEAIQLKFTPVNQDTVDGDRIVGTSSDWETGLITYDKTTGVGTWADVTRYLSQGKWKIEARAVDVDPTTTTVNEDKNVVAYGYTTTYVSKVNNSADIKLLAVSSEAVGKIAIDALTSDNVVSENTTDQRLKYTVYDLAGTSKLTGYLECEAISDDDKATYEALTATNLNAGSYYMTVQLEQYDEDTSKWIEATGGSAVDFIIQADKTTTITGSVLAAEYIDSEFSTKVDVNAIELTSVTFDTDTYTAKAKALTETVEVKKIIFFCGGVATPVNVDSDGAAEFSVPTAYGNYEIGVLAIGQTDEGEYVKSAMTRKHLYADLQRNTTTGADELKEWVSD